MATTQTDTAWLRWPEYSVLPIEVQEPSQPRDDPTVAFVVAVGALGPPPGLGCTRQRGGQARQATQRQGIGWLVLASAAVGLTATWQAAEWLVGLVRWIGGW